MRIQPELVGELLPLDGLDPVAATCTEPLACAIRAQDRVDLAAGDALLVVGAGASGLLHVAAARARGIERVLVAEPRPTAASGRWPGAPPPTTASRPTSRWRRRTVRTRSRRRPPRSARAAGCARTRRRSPGAPIAVDGAELFLRELTVTSSWSAGAAEMRAALALLRAGAVRTDELITHRFALEETGAALSAQRDGRALKAVVLP